MNKIQIGNAYGSYTVIKQTSLRKRGYIIWECQCICGRKVYKSTKDLLRLKSPDCMCRTEGNRNGNIAENLTGRKFGLLTVIERVENRKDRTCWRCLCECGNEKTATAHDLKAGKVKSCGCLRHARHTRYRDLTGERIGRLTVLRPTSDRDKKGSVIWECKCDCGNTVCFSEDQLKHGHCKSCGCLRNELRKDIHNQLHLVDGTCVEMLEKRKHRKDNTSGFRGVYKLKDGGYRASIGFRGKRYHLGMFTDFNEAVEARINAERLTHDKFVHEYHLWEEKAKADPEWGELNPFRCNIRLT